MVLCTFQDFDRYERFYKIKQNIFAQILFIAILLRDYFSVRLLKYKKLIYILAARPIIIKSHYLTICVYGLNQAN